MLRNTVHSLSHPLKPSSSHPEHFLLQARHSIDKQHDLIDVHLPELLGTQRKCQVLT